MVELPEAATLSRQIARSLGGARIATADRGNAEHKFFWCNLDAAELEHTLTGKTIGKTWYAGRFFFVAVDPGYTLFMGDIGGRILLTPPANPQPKKQHLRVGFEDGSALTVTVQMWGFVQIVPSGEERNHPYGVPSASVRRSREGGRPRGLRAATGRGSGGLGGVIAVGS